MRAWGGVSHEPIIAKRPFLLNALNDLLQKSAVMIQPIHQEIIGAGLKIKDEDVFVDVPLPLEVLSGEDGATSVKGDDCRIPWEFSMSNAIFVSDTCACDQTSRGNFHTQAGSFFIVLFALGFHKGSGKEIDIPVSSRLKEGLAQLGFMSSIGFLRMVHAHILAQPNLVGTS